MVLPAVLKGISLHVRTTITIIYTLQLFREYSSLIYCKYEYCTVEWKEIFDEHGAVTDTGSKIFS